MHLCLMRDSHMTAIQRDFFYVIELCPLFLHPILGSWTLGSVITENRARWRKSLLEACMDSTSTNRNCWQVSFPNCQVLKFSWCNNNLHRTISCIAAYNSYFLMTYYSRMMRRWVEYKFVKNVIDFYSNKSMQCIHCDKCLMNRNGAFLFCFSLWQRLPQLPVWEFNCF